MTDLHLFEPLGRKSKRLRSAPERRIVRSRPDARSKLVGHSIACDPESALVGKGKRRVLRIDSCCALSPRRGM